MRAIPRKIRAYPCEDCGVWTVRPRLSYSPRICAACGRARIDAARLRRWHPDHAYTPGRDTEVPHPKE